MKKWVKKEMDSKRKMLYMFVVGITVFVLIVYVSFLLPVSLIKDYGMDFSKIGEYGDMFGSFNSFMSALAFVGLIYTIMRQRKEFNRTQQDVQNQLFLQLEQSKLMDAQLHESIKVKKAEFLHDIMEKVAFDQDIVEFINKTDYKKIRWYNENFHGGSRDERLADKTLSFLSYILYLKNEGVISERELYFVKYILKRVLTDHQVHCYLFNLYHFDKSNFLYQNLIDYAKHESWLASDFFDKNAGGNIYDVFL